MFLGIVQVQVFIIVIEMLKFIKCEPPSSFYNRPSPQPFIPTYPSSDTYNDAPENPSTGYGVPTQSNYGSETPAPVVTKHIYTFISPPEPQYNSEYPVKNTPPQPLQKHYRIIFIKAPTQPAPTVNLPTIQPASEEKTIVYVLVKKPDELPEIIMPTPATTLPTKPEVYFIRYKTEEKVTQDNDQSGGYYKK